MSIGPAAVDVQIDAVGILLYHLVLYSRSPQTGCVSFVCVCVCERERKREGQGERERGEIFTPVLYTTDYSSCTRYSSKSKRYDHHHTAVLYGLLFENLHSFQIICIQRLYYCCMYNTHHHTAAHEARCYKYINTYLCILDHILSYLKTFLI